MAGYVAIKIAEFLMAWENMMDRQRLWTVQMYDIDKEEEKEGSGEEIEKLG